MRTYLEPESDPTKPGWVEAPIGEELATPHGLYLFKTREEPIRYFAPNFEPPYNTPEKRSIIEHVLRRVWNPSTLSWEPAPWARGPG